MKNKKKFALISLFDKTNILEICEIITKFKISIISTGTTAKHIKELGFKCKLVSNLTGFKEILDGRVKTIHPKIHASLLFERENKEHIKTFNKLNFPEINFVIVNLYPFSRIIKKTKDKKKCIDMIDIGGPTLIRSSAKNYKSVTTISSPMDYKMFIKNISTNNGETTLEFREKMAIKSFGRVSKYDNIISSWLNSGNKKTNLKKDKTVFLKYGENPHQKSFYKFHSKKNPYDESKIQGDEISYNNILDLNAGLDCVKEFSEPTSVIIKHNNPCGVASSKNINLAFKKSLSSDPVSAFGGIIILNRKVDIDLAKILSKHFFVLIAAPSFSLDAKKNLKNKKKLILIKTTKIITSKKDEIKSVAGGYLMQGKNLLKISQKSLRCVSIKKSQNKTLEDLLFALKVAKHVKSNAVILAKNKQTIGIGAGQMSRLDSTKIAISKINKNFKNLKFVAASDAFFPFNDNLELLVKKTVHQLFNQWDQ